MRQINQGAAANVMVLLVQEDHITGATGLTLAVTASKDGAAFAAITPTITERGNGWYNLALSAGDTDTLGDLAIHVTAAGADPCDLICRVISEPLAAASYTAPDNAGIAAIPTNPLLSDDARLLLLDAAISSRLAAADYTDPANGDVAAILAAVQAINIVSGRVLADIRAVNGIAVDGSGTDVDPWGPV